MMKAKSFVLLLVIAGLVAVIVAPAAFGMGSADVKMKLTGPDSAANGAMVQLTCKISNPLMTDGYRAAVIMQNKDGNLKRIGSKAITWNSDGSKGTVVFWVKAQASAMGMAKYRAAWMHPEGTSHSNRLSIEID
jgi:hypothetical protein